MRREIQYIIIERHDIISIYGFGSFFRLQRYNDIDLLVVVSDSCSNLVDLYYHIKTRFERLGDVIGERIHMLVLTEEEFVSRPLRNMDELVELFRRDKEAVTCCQGGPILPWVKIMSGLQSRWPCVVAYVPTIDERGPGCDGICMGRLRECSGPVARARFARAIFVSCAVWSASDTIAAVVR